MNLVPPSSHAQASGITSPSKTKNGKETQFSTFQGSENTMAHDAPSYSETGASSEYTLQGQESSQSSYSETKIPGAFSPYPQESMQPNHKKQNQGTPASMIDVPSSPESPPERKRPTSLFERFTGVARGRLTNQETKPTVSVISTPEKQSGDDADILEIPAFLRREG
jgi:cell division protein FtsZ